MRAERPTDPASARRGCGGDQEGAGRHGAEVIAAACRDVTCRRWWRARACGQRRPPARRWADRWALEGPVARSASGQLEELDVDGALDEPELEELPEELPEEPLDEEVELLEELSPEPELPEPEPPVEELALPDPPDEPPLLPSPRESVR